MPIDNDSACSEEAACADEVKKTPEENADQFTCTEEFEKNTPFTEKEYAQYRKDFDKFRQLNKFPGKSLFEARLTDSGQVKWTSKFPVSASDIYEVMRYTVNHGRSLHINVGTYGNQNEKAVVEDAEAKSDLSVLVSISKYSPALTEKQYPSIDFIEAWCRNKTTDHGMTPTNDTLARKLQRYIMVDFCEKTFPQQSQSDVRKKRSRALEKEEQSSSDQTSVQKSPEKLSVSEYIRRYSFWGREPDSSAAPFSTAKTGLLKTSRKV